MKISTRMASLAAAAAVVAGAAGCAPATSATPAAPAPAGSSTATTSAPSPTTSASPLPPVSRATPRRLLRTSKVMTIVIENHSLAQMQQGMPYLTSLAEQYGYATDYRAITHPSLPNYLAIAFGSTAGVTDDRGPSVHQVKGDSVFSQANTSSSAGGRIYAESMTTDCQLSNTYPYAVRHNPWSYGSPGCSTGSVPAGTPSAGRLSSDAAAGTLPCAGMLVPDLVHDAHDAPLAEADSYLQSWLPTLMGGTDFRSGKLAIVVTADEDDRSSTTNRVLTVVLSRAVSHRVVTTRLTHYSLSRLYSSVCGDRHYLGEAASAPSLRTAFGLDRP